MSKKVAPEVPAPEEKNSENDAFEMIELAIDDLNVLTKAFHVIQKVCDEASGTETKIDLRVSQKLIN